MKQTKNIIDFFEYVIKDSRLCPSHISMYIALFQLWSLNKFQNPFRIYRNEVMKLSKIKSSATYHKCIRELHSEGFIIYSPSYNPFRGSLIKIVDFEKEGMDEREFKYKKLLLQEETYFSVPKFYEVELYFTERDLPSSEANKFYQSYHSKNWKLSNNKPMKCWEAAARIWISKVKDSIKNTTYEKTRS